MTGKSDYAENAWLDHVTGNTAYTQPAGLYLSLHTGDPLDDNSGATEVDPVVDDTAYARQAITFGAAVAGEATSTNAQTFSAVVYGSGAAPYVVTHIAVYDAVSAGNLIYSAPLSPNRTLSSGEIATFDVGAVTLTED